MTNPEEAEAPKKKKKKKIALLGDGPQVLDNESVATTSTELDQNLQDYDSEETDFESGQHQCTTHRPGCSSNLLPSTTAMETEANDADLPMPKTDDAYYQCNSAHSACRKETLVSVSHDTSFGKTVTVQSPPIGSLLDHGEMDQTFHGSRVMKGHTIPFDPGNLTCLSCAGEHNIIGKTPVINVLTDQNFPANLGCADG